MLVTRVIGTPRKATTIATLLVTPLTSSHEPPQARPLLPLWPATFPR